MLLQEHNIISTGERETGEVEQDDLRERLCQVEKLVETLKMELVSQRVAMELERYTIHFSDLPFLDALSLPNAPRNWPEQVAASRGHINETQHFIKVCSVGRLACKLARFFIF